MKNKSRKDKKEIEALEKEWYDLLERKENTTNPFEYAWLSIAADRKLKELKKLGL